MSTALVPLAERAAGRARDWLLAAQDGDGWWKGELETNVTIDAEDLLARQFLGIRTAEETAETARWIRSKRREDGTWATFHGGPPDLSTTIEAYLGLRLAGDPVDDPELVKAAEFVRRGGGIEASRVFTRLWLALFGLYPWGRLPAMPPELIMLPPWFPLNVYDWACWARQTIVPITVLASYRPVRPLGVTLDELWAGPSRPRGPRSVVGRLFNGLDRVLHVYERRPVRGLRRRALQRSIEWIARRQEADGSWGGIQPPWVYSLLALHVHGTHPSALRAGIEGMARFTLHDEHGRRFEACQSPVWDTALVVAALADAGVPSDDPSLKAAAGWLLDEEVTARGDWAVRRPHLPAGGWAFEFDNDLYPDTDDTAAVLLALHLAGLGDGAVQDRAIAWLEGMQCRDGGWAAFDVDNDSGLVARLPFCDFGAVTDPPSADVTAHVIEALCAFGRGSGEPVRRGVRWLLGQQHDDGSWFGRWGANHVYGTGAAVPALAAAGLPADHPSIRLAVGWLLRHQNEDGGWGEDPRSYRDPGGWAGRGTSTASQTAWALMGLLAAGRGVESSVARGVAFLCRTQREDGSWPEPQFTGTGFPGDFYINYHLYRQVYPLRALGLFLRARGEPR